MNKKIRKAFDGVEYVGTVVSYDEDTKWYKIVYTDNDWEEMTENEVKAFQPEVKEEPKVKREREEKNDGGEESKRRKVSSEEDWNEVRAVLGKIRENRLEKHVKISRQREEKEKADEKKE